MNYDPKNYTDLKDYYKKEQKKHDRDQKRIDDVLSRLMEDNIDANEIKQIEMEFLQSHENNKTQEKEIDREIQSLITRCGDSILDDLNSEKETKCIRIKKVISVGNSEQPVVPKVNNDTNSEQPVIKKIRIIKKN